MGVFVLIGVAGLIVTWIRYLRDGDLRRIGTTAAGEVLSSETRFSRYGSTTHLEVMFFSHLDQEITASMKARGWHRPKAGRMVEVIFDPNNPRGARLKSELLTVRSTVGLIVLASGFILFGLFF